MQQLLRERGSIHSSSAQLDDVLGQAQAAVSSLAAQRSLFADISTKLGTVGAKFPVVNSLVTSIRRKKSKDTIVLSVVVTLCTLFLLAYRLR
jgi:Golgi SNAP receptor complex protein 1